jgi:hypothetical protein
MSARAEPPITHDRDLDAVLVALVDGVQAAIGKRLVGAYLHGSSVAGDFDRHSDVDFLVAVGAPLTWEELRELQALHIRLYDGSPPWAQRLDGSYVPLPILRRDDGAGTKLPYIDNGSRRFVASVHCNREVIRWMVRERSITLAGPDPRELIDPVSAASLRRQVLLDMRLWAKEIEADPDAMDNRSYQPYAVLSYCRMLSTVERGGVVSKPTAARWAVAALGPEWAGLIERAQAQRDDPARGVRQKADPADLAQTHRFIDAVLARVAARAE